MKARIMIASTKFLTMIPHRKLIYQIGFVQKKKALSLLASFYFSSIKNTYIKMLQLAKKRGSRKCFKEWLSVS